ncbi:hypothetical protein LSH36_154g09017, partial [Paralvinella palmiformis]
MGKNRNAGRKGRNKKSAQVYLPFATKGKDQNLEKGSTVQEDPQQSTSSGIRRNDIAREVTPDSTSKRGDEGQDGISEVSRRKENIESVAENQPGTASSRANGKEQLSEGLTERKGDEGQDGISEVSRRKENIESVAENQPGTASSRANGKEQLSEGLTERKGDEGQDGISEVSRRKENIESVAENQPGTASSRANGKEQLSEGLTEGKGHWMNQDKAVNVGGDAKIRQDTNRDLGEKEKEKVFNKGKTGELKNQNASSTRGEKSGIRQ